MIPSYSFSNNIFINLDNNNEYFFNDFYLLSKKYIDYHKDNYVSNYNLIDQLSMLYQINNIINYYDYDYALFMRDDLLITKISPDLTYLLNNIKNYVFMPSWFWWNGYNDRFSVFASNKIKKISSRILLVPEFLEKYGFLNAEILMYYCLKKAKYKVISGDVRHYRVRLNSKIRKESYTRHILRPKELVRVFLSYCRCRTL